MSERTGAILSPFDANGSRMTLAEPIAVWIDAEPRPGWLNMAIDQALLERAAAGERWLRLYRWAPSCLSFGRHEPAARRYARERIAALGLSVVRRPSGGRAVWHAGELTYAVAAPAEEFGGLRQAYEGIHAMLRDAVRALGAAAHLAPPRPAAPVGSGACFSHSAGGEVLVDGRKVVGSAQLRLGHALLQHGSLLLEDDQAMVAGMTRRDAPPDLSAPLSRLLGRTITWQQAADAVVEAAGARWPLTASHESGVPLGAARHSARFQSPEWTWSGAGGR